MYKNLLAVLILTPCFSYGQDTTFYDEKHQKYDVVTDTSTISHELYKNGNLKTKIVYFHPQGQSSYKDIMVLKRTESYFDESGWIAASYEYLNNQLDGNYLMYDDSTFVTHFIFRNDSLVDVLNTNCCYINHSGKIISKSEFLKSLYTKEFGEWSYYLFKGSLAFEGVSCCDFFLHSEKYFDFLSSEKAKTKFVKRLIKNCP